MDEFDPLDEFLAKLFLVFQGVEAVFFLSPNSVHLAGAVEYTDCFSAEG